MTSRTTEWRTPWRSNLRWVFVAVWLIFLGYPLASVATSEHSVVVKTTGFVVICVFAVVYVLAAVYVMPGIDTPTRRGIQVFAILAVLAAALFPIIGADAFGVAPFLMVVAAFTFELRRAAITIAALVVSSFVVPTLCRWEVDLGVVAILVAVGASMMGMRVLTMRESEREKSEERQRQLNEQLAVVAERERVARDVHDILGHSLTVISVKAELAGRLIDLDPDRARSEITEVNSLARDALAQIRSTVGQLRSPNLPDTIAAAESALLAAGIGADFPACDAIESLSPADAELFAWALREAITNVVRHSGAATCAVSIDDHSLSVRDNGHGINVEHLGNGLRGLTERVESAGGRLRLSGDGEGTVLTVEMLSRERL